MTVGSKHLFGELCGVNLAKYWRHCMSHNVVNKGVGTVQKGVAPLATGPGVSPRGNCWNFRCKVVHVGVCWALTWTWKVSSSTSTSISRCSVGQYVTRRPTTNYPVSSQLNSTVMISSVVGSAKSCWRCRRLRYVYLYLLDIAWLQQNAVVMSSLNDHVWQLHLANINNYQFTERHRELVTFSVASAVTTT